MSHSKIMISLLFYLLFVGQCTAIELVQLYPHGLTDNFEECKEFPRLELNTSLMLSLLNAKMTGDSAATYFSGAYLAATKEDAEYEFINMLPIHDPSGEINAWLKGNSHLKPTPLAKRHIVKALQTVDQFQSLKAGKLDQSRQTFSDGVISKFYEMLVFPEEIGISPFVKRPSGAYSTVEYCRPKGDSSGYLLPLCSICAMTTELPETFFPPWINEVYCGDSAAGDDDTGCLSVNYMDHGSCQQNIIWFSVLEAVPSKCEVVTIVDNKQLYEQLKEDMASSSNSSTTRSKRSADLLPPSWRDYSYWVDGWDIIPQPVNTGCECMLHKDSFLNGGNSKHAYIGRKRTNHGL